MSQDSPSSVLERTDLFLSILTSMRHDAQTPQQSIPHIITPQQAAETIIYIPPIGQPINSKAVYYIFPLLAFLILCLPVIIGYALSWGLQLGNYILSVYAFLSLAHFLLQVILASINRYLMYKIPNAPINRESQVCFLVVGYREDPVYWRRCLESIKAQSVPNMHVVAVIDGDSVDDEYMAETFVSVFDEPRVIKPGFVLADLNGTDRKHFAAALLKQMQMNVCIMQPHAGKRCAIYTGIRLLSRFDSVVVTDSDTILHSQAVQELYSALVADESNGAATGYVDIDNDMHFLSFMSSLRYWFAFNLERACDSVSGNVTCISGPLGIYRMHAITDVIDSWVSQRFLGERCTYGDDRHLTNLVLKQGYRTLFTPKACCKTETPTNAFRWISQQTRWTKSYYREMLFYRPEYLGLKSLWVYASLIFNAFFPLMNVYGIIHILFISPTLNSTNSLKSLILWIVTVVCVAFVKSMYGFIISRRWRLLVFPAYSLLYIFILLPIKMCSVLFMKSNSWLTSPRLNSTSSVQVGMTICIALWIVLIIGGIVYCSIESTKAFR